MRIAYVSTYPPIECGIGTYTQFLIDAMKKTKNELHVVSQYGAYPNNEIDIHPTYDPSDPNLSKKIFDLTMKLTPDVVHIQHEYGLYGDMDGIAILDLVYRFKSSKIPTIATFHTVRKETEYRKHLILETLCQALDSIIVHEEAHIGYLKEHYNADPSKIYHIPHGAREIAPIKDAKKKLSLEKYKVLLLLGYIRPNKGFEKIVKIFPEIVKKVPEARLIISGKLRVNDVNKYHCDLMKSIENSPAKDHIEVFRGQFPQRTFDYIINSANVIAFPYTLGAQSGIMAHALSFGKPVVASTLPAFVDTIKESGCGFIAENDQDYIDNITKLLTDDKLNKQCSKNALHYVKNKISWDIIARKTEKIYNKFDTSPACQSRYIYFG